MVNINKIVLNGTIWNIIDSHKIGNIQYQKANLTVRNSNGKNSVLTLQFKKFQCNCKENDDISIVGNIRSYSKKINDNKNKVDIYVYTYFDSPENSDVEELQNQFIVTGRICKLEAMRYLENDKNNIHFIIANNIISNDTKLNSYLPCIAWGKCAYKVEKLNKNDNVAITGELRSREYKKPLENGEFEIKVAHELVVTDISLLKEDEKAI